MSDITTKFGTVYVENGRHITFSASPDNCILQMRRKNGEIENQGQGVNPVEASLSLQNALLRRALNQHNPGHVRDFRNMADEVDEKTETICCLLNGVFDFSA